jgi:hypothetical protein
MASVPVFMFCAPKLVFGGTEGVGSRFRRNRGRRLLFSCFALPDLVSTAWRASVLILMFCSPELFFGGTEGVRSHFHILRARTRFRRYRGPRVPFSYFALTNSFSAVQEASSPVFMFYAPGLIIGGTEGIGSRLHILRSQTRFRRYRGRRVPYSCFARSDTFSAVQRASVLVFMFCALGLVFRSTKGVRSRFHILRARTRFRRYQGHRVPFSYFALLDSFSVVPRASDPVFMFCARTCFQRYGGRRFSFSCFARQD